jgi:dCMP deaminase
MLENQNRIEKNECFMLLAKVISLRSRDPNTQVGSILVSKNNIIVGEGWNGHPKGLNNLSWDKNNRNPLKNKYFYVLHSECNAILNCLDIRELKEGSIFVTHFPCCECCKMIIQVGIKNVYYLENKHKKEPEYIASEILLKKAKINCKKIKLKHNIIVL